MLQVLLSEGAALVVGLDHGVEGVDGLELSLCAEQAADDFEVVLCTNGGRRFDEEVDGGIDGASGVVFEG